MCIFKNKKLKEIKSLLQELLRKKESQVEMSTEIWIDKGIDGLTKTWILPGEILPVEKGDILSWSFVPFFGVEGKQLKVSEKSLDIVAPPFESVKITNEQNITLRAVILKITLKPV